MRRVIIESPFGSEDPAIVERNRRYLCACMADCLRRGEAPYASHGLYMQPGVLDDNKSEERKLGIDAGFVWRRVADATILYSDLGTSQGMKYGFDDADKIGHTIERRWLGAPWSDHARTP